MTDPRPLRQRLAACDLEQVPHLFYPAIDEEQMFAVRAARLPIRRSQQKTLGEQQRRRLSLRRARVAWLPKKEHDANDAILTYCWFLQHGNPNVISRAAVALSIVEDGTLSIDRYQECTIDKAYARGRFYSDKAPGMALLAIPVIVATRFGLKTLGIVAPLMEEGRPTSYFGFYVYVSTLLTSGLFTAVTAAVLFLTARGLGATQAGAIFGSLCYSVATPAFGWATAFFGHATAGACLFLAFAAVVELRRERSSPRYPILLGCSIGGFLGLAAIVEFTTMPAAAVIALFALGVATSLNSWARWCVLGCAFICGVIVLSPLWVYNYLAFGSPMHLGYESVVGFAGSKQGFMGIGAPKLDVLVQILFGRYRGLFVVSPILLLSVWSIIAIWRKGLLSNDSFFCIVAVAVTFLFINSGYYYWNGGWSTGPRHLTPMIALLCLPLALQWSSAGSAFRGILLAFAVVSIIISLACASVSMTVDEHGGFYQRPLFAALDCLIGFELGFWRASAFYTDSGGGEGAMPRRCVSGTAIV